MNDIDRKDGPTEDHEVDAHLMAGFDDSNEEEEYVEPTVEQDGDGEDFEGHGMSGFD